MEAKVNRVTEILEDLDRHPEAFADDLENLSSDQEFLEYLIRNLNEKGMMRILRQLLQHTQQTVLGNVISNEDLPGKLVECVRTQQIDYDNIWVFCELCDESMYKEVLKGEILEKLVNSLDGCPETTCPNLIKVLLMASDYHLNEILGLQNSRYFGEMLVLRMNWANGPEQKKIAETILRIIEKSPDFFYVNDLKMIFDIVIQVLQNGEQEISEVFFLILAGILDIQDFFERKYRFDEVFELFEGEYRNQKILYLKQRIFARLNENLIHS